MTTQDVYLDDAGHYLPQRAALHEAIVSDCVPTRTTDVDPDRIPEAFFTIGPPGAGKTSTLRGLVHACGDMGHGHAGMPLAIVDADQVRTALPEYASGLGSTVVGAECYDVTYDRVFPAALASRSDLVYDTLGGVDSVRLSIERLMDAGYRVHVLRAELYAAVQGGKSLAAVAKDQKVSVDSLVKAMVADANADLAAAVKAGTMTQAQADTMKSSLTARITDQVNGVRAGRGPGRGAGYAPSTGATSNGTSSTPSSTT